MFDSGCRLRSHAVPVTVFFTTVFPVPGSALQGCLTVSVQQDSHSENDKLDLGGQPASCWSVARIQEADLADRHGQRKESSYTCHCEKIVLHRSETSKQPEALEQYGESSDFIHSFNTRMASFLVLLPPPHSTPPGCSRGSTDSVVNVLANDSGRDNDPRP